MSLILRLVHKLHPLPTTFVLPLYVIILMASYGISVATSSAYNVMVLLFMRYCCYGRSPVLKKRKSDKEGINIVVR